MPTSQERYVNAREVLPPELVAAVQSYVGPSAINLWVPSTSRDAAAQRARQVRSLYQQGAKPPAIATQVGLSVRRVYQILSKARGAS